LAKAWNRFANNALVLLTPFEGRRTQKRHGTARELEKRGKKKSSQHFAEVGREWNRVTNGREGKKKKKARSDISKNTNRTFVSKLIA